MSNFLKGASKDAKSILIPVSVRENGSGEETFVNLDVNVFMKGFFLHFFGG